MLERCGTKQKFSASHGGYQLKDDNIETFNFSGKTDPGYISNYQSVNQQIELAYRVSSSHFKMGGGVSELQF